MNTYQNYSDLPLMLGHFAAGFTLDTYAHVTTAAQKEAAQTMGNVLSMGQTVSPSPEQNSHPTTRCRDCTIAFRNCKSFLVPKKLPPDGII